MTIATYGLLEYIMPAKDEDGNNLLLNTEHIENTVHAILQKDGFLREGKFHVRKSCTQCFQC